VVRTPFPSRIRAFPPDVSLPSLLFSCPCPRGHTHSQERTPTTNGHGQIIVSDNLISDWRISTIKCAELSGTEELNSTSASNYIYAILAPLLAKRTRPSGEDTLRAGILELCKDAFKLRMLMRKSKNRYLVKTIDPGKTVLLSACENTAYSVSVEGGNNSEESNEMAYVLFGALVKQPQTADQPEKVLEKAQVVLKRK